MNKTERERKINQLGQSISYKIACVHSKDSACTFVCVEVLRPSQPNGVMLSMVSLPNNKFTGLA